jgi:hypothetical protein
MKFIVDIKSRFLFYLFLNVFLSVCPIWLSIFSYFSMNGPELGAGIDPGMAFNPFPF